jgi:hypothetical protein
MRDMIEDDWEYQEIAPLVFRSSEQLRILEERRLIEENDNAIIEDLFLADDKLAVNLTNNLTNNIANNLTNNFIEKEKNKTTDNLNKAVLQINKKLEEKIKLKTSRQMENEQKQKELSNVLKKQKEDKKRLAEIYGESLEDDNTKYAYYESKFFD